MPTGYSAHHSRCPLETGPWDIPGVQCECPRGWPKRKKLITIRTVSGTYQPVYEGMVVGPFLIHKSVRKRGWTITHFKTADAVIIGLPNKPVTFAAARELMALFSKWGQCKSHFDLLHDVRRLANHREFYAIANYLYELRQTHPRAK